MEMVVVCGDGSCVCVRAFVRVSHSLQCGELMSEEVTLLR